jgi:peptidoglycan-N-acetylglucosamine deacetylase
VQFWRKLVALPWSIIALFDAAALIALALMLALVGHSSHHAIPVAPVGDKRIALSFDDAPRGPGGLLNVDARPQILITALREAGVKQAVFFVNPGRIDASNGHSAILTAYTDAGHVLGNHTANHKRLSTVSAEAFLADVDAAEVWLKPHAGYRPLFRFPELDEGGADKAKRDAVRTGLKARGLRNGYVTADAWDWELDSLARKAIEARKSVDMAALRALYVENHVEAAEFADRLARKALGRAPAQVLLLHDTDLAALYLPDLVKALQAKGWRIITSDEAYADPLAKEQPDLRDTNGTILQMVARAKKVPGPYWFDRNEVQAMRMLFDSRVLRQK